MIINLDANAQIDKVNTYIMSSMLRKYYFFIVLMAMLNLSCANEVIPQNEAPDAIINLAYSIRYDDKYLSELKNNLQGKLAKRNLYVLNELSSLGNDFLSAFAFLSCFCKVQSESIGHFCNNKKRVASDLQIDALYVTTPIEELANSIIIIVSTSSPERTQIAILQDHLPAKLIYDSFSASNYCETKILYPLRVAQSLAVLDKGVFKIHEAGNSTKKEGARNIVLKIYKGRCSITVD